MYKGHKKQGVLCLLAKRFLLCLTMLSLMSCEQQPPHLESQLTIGDITKHRLQNISDEPGVWLTGGRDYQQSYHSPLKTINPQNIQQLGFAWQYEVNTTHGFQATPIVVDGLMFSSGPKGAVYALDAKTGGERWYFEPNIDDKAMRKVCCGPVNRGLAVWQGRVYVASLDGYLYALKADTGVVDWKVDTITDRDRGYTVTGAPYIANDVVVIGNSGAEMDARGYVTAYDTNTGDQRWRFFTVPGNPKNGFEHPELAMAAKTWDPDSLWEVGLGGTVWDGMAYDPKLNILYVGTGNGTPHPRKLRSPKGGDNLFLSSILAINPDTGRLLWHYQTTPGDNWDYTATQKMILADLNIEGTVRKVIMQAPKNGFFYVLDRTSGELISAEPYVEVTWASHVDMQTGRPVETTQGHYMEEPKLVFPSWYGGHNWQPMSYNPNTGLVYIPTIEMPVIFTTPKQPFTYQKGGANAVLRGIFPIPGPLGMDSEAAKNLPDFAELAKNQPDSTIKGFLKAWDPVNQRIVWQVETSGPWRGSPSAAWNGGGLMTSAGGLLFQGRATGQLVILDSRTGKQLHSIDVGTSMMAAPMTYSIDGEQYVAIMAGTGGSLGSLHPPGSAAEKYGNQGRIVSFKLGGGSVPQREELIRQSTDFPMPPISRRGTTAQRDEGKLLFQRNCSQCHKNSGGGAIPDLRMMNKKAHTEFLDIVLKGLRSDKGMGSFAGLLSAEQAESLHIYLIDLAWKTYELEHKPKDPHQPEAAQKSIEEADE